MFENEHKKIATLKATADALEAKFIKECQALGIKHVFDFPGSKAKTADALAKLVDDASLKELLELDKKVTDVHKLYEAEQVSISTQWKEIESQQKKRAADILEALEAAKKQVFDNSKYHPGVKMGFLTPEKVKLIKEAIAVK